MVSKLKKNTTVISEKCKNMKFENDNEEYGCVYYTQVDRYNNVNELVDFYDNRHEIISESLFII